jgi:nitroreductase/NAD-dependent dihydropyrimidine dehydrogenase PreA subunit
MDSAKLRIDRETCNRCGLCVTVCPTLCFAQPARDEAPTIVRPETCIDCGHCIAICPTDAVRHAEIAPAHCPPADAYTAISPEHLLHILRRRRSVRFFRDEPVPRPLLEMMLEAGRFAPSASNTQVFQFIVIQDRERIRRLSRLTLAPFRLALRMLENPVTRILARLVMGNEMVEQGLTYIDFMRRVAASPQTGEDRIFFHAPALILIHAPKHASFGATDCANAQHQMALMADALGLGTTTIGFFMICYGYSPAIRREVGLPKGHRLYGTLSVGWPRYRWRRLPDRRPARVRWE